MMVAKIVTEYDGQRAVDSHTTDDLSGIVFEKLMAAETSFLPEFHVVSTDNEEQDSQGIDRIVRPSSWVDQGVAVQLKSHQKDPDDTEKDGMDWSHWKDTTRSL